MCEHRWGAVRLVIGGEGEFERRCELCPAVRKATYGEYRAQRLARGQAVRGVNGRRKIDHRQYLAKKRQQEAAQ